MTVLDNIITSIVGKTVESVTHDPENGIMLTFTEGTVLHVWGGIPRSRDVNVTVNEGPAIQRKISGEQT